MNLAELFHLESDLIVIPGGDYLFRTGDSHDRMYVLLDGTAHVIVGGKVVEEAKSGALLGEMALIDHAPRAACVMAVSECRFVPIDERRFHFLIIQTPKFATHVMRIMAERLRAMNQLISEGARDNAL
jgi:CRP/FNR family transcriptional regulator, cyclic AMP receptor protein